MHLILHLPMNLQALMPLSILWLAQISTISTLILAPIVVEEVDLAKWSSSQYSLNPFAYIVNTIFLHCNNQLPSNSQHLRRLRLGHPNNHTLKIVLKHCNIFTCNNDKDISTFYNACCIWKAHKLHSPVSQIL